MITSWKNWGSQLALASCVIVGGAIASANCAFAQITPDGTLPNNSRVITQDNIRTIEGGTQAGGNLFHSFREFSVPTGGTAFFNNAQGIQNIISRVTGGSVSNIDGLIRANGTANLFLINPNGIVFGRNASLNIGGSFVATTASSLKFADGSQFSAIAAQSTPLLTISVPMGLQYGANPGSIQVQGDGQGLRSTSELIDTTSGLWVQPNQTLALVGGDVSLEGATLKTAGGRIELGSVGHNSLVSLTPINKGFALGYDTVQNFGNIQLSQQAAVDASGAGGGDIQVMGRRVTLTNGSQIEASTLGAEQGGNLVVNAQDSVQLIGISADSQFPTGLFANAYPSATGAAGNLRINTRELLVRDGGQVSASTYGAGNAGNLTVRADSVQLIGASSNGRSRSSLLTETSKNSTGAAGDLTINTRELLAQNGAFVGARTFGAGNAGNLTVNADSVQLTGNSLSGDASALIATSEEAATGAAGNLTINTSKLSLEDGAQVSAGTWGPLKGGNLIVTADSVQVIGIGTLSVSSLNTNAFATATGAAGNLTINTRELLVRDGGQVSAGTWGPLKGGNLTVRADSVQVIGGTSDLRSSLNTQAFATATGAAGDLSINTRELLVRDGGEVSASTYGAGKGGNIDITAGSLFITNGGLLNASTSGQGDAGSVNINARDTVSFNRSGAYSTVQNGAVGKGGNINITTRSLSLTDGAFLNSSTFGRGDAGSVTIQASGPVSFNGVNSTGQSSFVSSTVESGAVGNGGSINIKAGSLSLTDGANIQTLVRGASYHNKLSPGRGNAGNVSIDVRDAVTIAGINKKIGYFGGIVSSVSPGAVGDGGSINIKAGSFSLTDGGTLSADTLGQGEGGNINLDVKGAILLSGGSTAFDTGESTRITLGVIPGAIGSGGDLYIKASSLVMTDGAIVKDSTQGQGNAGNIYVDADVVDISGSVPSNGLPSGLFTSTTTNGRAGDIIINTQTFRIADGAALSARSKGDGQAGNIRVNASSFEATNGGQLVTTTFGKGQAGNILINATDRVSISGSDPNYSNRIAKFPSPINPSVANDITETGATSGLFANTEPNSTAQGGGIKITTGQLVVQNRAEVTVNSAGLGNAGSLTVNANSIKLDTQGKLAGTTASGRGGDIRLDVQDFILMRNNSAIATTAAKNGSGGNITINSPFIVAVPDENSDIVANAEHGPGGKIEINATGIYGLEERTKLSEDPKISEINASSEFGANGTVELNTPDVDLSRGFVNLPAVPVDTKVAQGCTAGGSQAQSEFIITGRGGLPPNPGDALSTDAVQVDLITLNPEVDQPSTTAVSTNPTSPTPARIVEATGWVIDADGNVVLTANASTVTPHNSWQKTADCRAFNQQPGG